MSTAGDGAGAPAIEVERLQKVYPGGATALAGVSFAVGRGEVFGFLGPNGSGKTTTVRILGTLLRQTSGSARVGGFDTAREPARVRELIGYAAQATGVDDDLTVHENLALQVLLHRASPAEIKERAEQLVEALGLSELLNQRVGRLSGGAAPPRRPCAGARPPARRSLSGRADDRTRPAIARRTLGLTCAPSARRG